MLTMNFNKRLFHFVPDRPSSGGGGSWGDDPHKDDDALTKAFCQAVNGNLSSYARTLPQEMRCDSDNLQVIAEAIAMRVESIGHVLDMLSPKLRQIVEHIQALPEDKRTTPDNLLQRFRNFDLTPYLH